MENKTLVIITGLSGSGKTTALKFLEDFGFFCIDNVPPVILKDLVTILKDNKIDELAVVIDIRTLVKFSNGNIEKIIDEQKKEIENMNIKFKIIFFEADDDEILYRYQKSRRSHPLNQYHNLLDAIRIEREKLSGIKSMADFVVNSSGMDTKELGYRVLSMVSSNRDNLPPIRVKIQSFGFVNGIPNDSNMVFDVRFLPNPYYRSDLTEKTGKEREIQEYIKEYSGFDDFYGNLYNVVKNTIEGYEKTGRNQLKIAIGCTGGKHRSVFISELLYRDLKSDKRALSISHRELGAES